MCRVVARLILRLALIAASLAWAGFVFTHTVGDPGRGERIAEAVLDDDDARAEVVSRISDTVIASTGLPADQQPFVAARVDQLLRDPSGARTFIDPFAGQWARMLGDADPRPAQFDLAPLVDELVATTPGLDAGALPTDRFVVPSVPLPRAELPGIGGARRAVDATTLPLALVAVAGFAAAFIIGERRRVLRRVGIWAALAGGTWTVVPAITVWAARRWTQGADAVVAAAVEEAVTGLRPVAVALLAGGIVAFAASFAPALLPAEAHATPRVDRSRRVERHPAARQPVGRPATPRPSSPTPTATMPAQVVQRPAAAGPPPPDEGETDALWQYYS